MCFKCVCWWCMVVGKVSVSDCVPCDPGFYCLTAGSSNVTAKCLPGYYCINAASDPNPNGEHNYHAYTQDVKTGNWVIYKAQNKRLYQNCHRLYELRMPGLCVNMQTTCI